jgi:hypothetical protein
MAYNPEDVDVIENDSPLAKSVQRSNNSCFEHESRFHRVDVRSNHSTSKRCFYRRNAEQKALPH